MFAVLGLLCQDARKLLHIKSVLESATARITQLVSLTVWNLEDEDEPATHGFLTCESS
jgi:hypothetical protein